MTVNVYLSAKAKRRKRKNDIIINNIFLSLFIMLNFIIK